jgi:hypothetical protein
MTRTRFTTTLGRRRLLYVRLGVLAALGPGIISGFADNDAGGITTYSVVGAKFGYEMMWVLLASALALAVTQEAGARLGLATGRACSIWCASASACAGRWWPSPPCCSPTSATPWPSSPASARR